MPSFMMRISIMAEKKLTLARMLDSAVADIADSEKAGIKKALCARWGIGGEARQVVRSPEFTAEVGLSANVIGERLTKAHTALVEKGLQVAFTDMVIEQTVELVFADLKELARLRLRTVGQKMNPALETKEQQALIQKWTDELARRGVLTHGKKVKPEVEVKPADGRRVVKRPNNRGALTRTVTLAAATKA